MPRLSKIIVYGVVGLAILWFGGWLIKREQPVYAKWKLKRFVRKIEAWPASTNYSAAGWSHLVGAARAFQKANPKLAEDALAEYLQEYANKPSQLPIEQGKVFLLLRVVFDLPDRVQQTSAAGSGRPDLSADGAANPAWPLRWEEGKPRLVAGYANAAVSRKSIRDEYAYLRYRFRYRDLSNVKF